jgi:hypothetical protein
VSRIFQRQGAWWIDFKDAHSVRRRRKVGPNRRVAREVLNGILGSVARREHLGVIDDSQITFADFAKTWIERIGHTLKPRTHERFLGAIENHLRWHSPANSAASVLPRRSTSPSASRMERRLRR